jgi:hypothetical protein
MKFWALADEREFIEGMRSLWPRDEAKMVLLMDLYAMAGPKPDRPLYIEDYGDGLLCLPHTKGAYKGRCLFFTLRGPKNSTCVALIVYRKESQKADMQALERARNLMKRIGK